MKQHILAVVFAMLVLAAPALAQENTAQTTIDAEVRAGITPASPLYGLVTAWERTQLALTRDPAKRAERALAQADKKLAELEVLTQREEYERSERSINRYEELMSQAAEAVERAEQARSNQEARAALERSTRARAGLQARLDAVVDVQERVLTRQAERMSEEQLERVASAFNRANEAVLQADERFEESRQRAQTRIKALEELSDEEAAQLEANVSAQIGLSAALEARAENILSRMQERNEQLINHTSNRSEQANEQLSRVLEAQTQRLAENFERRNQQVEDNLRSRELADQLSARAQAVADARAQVALDTRERAIAEREAHQERVQEIRGVVREEESTSRPVSTDLRVHVEVASQEAQVTLYTDGSRSEFTVQSTSREEIARLIAQRLDVSYEAVIDATTWSSSEQRPSERPQQRVVQEISVTAQEDSSVAEILFSDGSARVEVESTNRERVIAHLAARLDLSEDRVHSLTTWQEASVRTETQTDARAGGVNGSVGVRATVR
ncbi:MAG: DUF5667 domain-containing protein [Candidatus Woesearchaeota archaeon]